MYIDTNVVLRALLNDHPSHSLKAQAFFKQCTTEGIQLKTVDAVIAELFYVLESSRVQPALSRPKIVDLVAPFITLTGLDFPSRKSFADFLVLYQKTKIDVADIFLFLAAKEAMQPVVSFDKDFDKLSQGIRKEP